MRYVIFIYTLVLIGACATVEQNPSIEPMKVCKTLCRGTVSKYSDDAVTCECGK